MALVFECTSEFAQNPLDTTDIVRDGDFTTTTWGNAGPWLWSSAQTSGDDSRPQKLLKLGCAGTVCVDHPKAGKHRQNYAPWDCNFSEWWLRGLIKHPPAQIPDRP
jgi:hypothetical protein